MRRRTAPALASTAMLPYPRCMARRRPDPAAPVSADDAALFRDAIGPVRELEVPEPPPSPPRPAPQPRQRDADEAAALEASRSFSAALDASAAGDAIEYLAEGLSPRLLRRLKRGHYRVQDELDLHRMTVPEAEAALRRFLQESLAAEHHCLCIVHGKGLRSGADGPVLKVWVEHWLRRRVDVLACVSAPPALGGTGAVLVLLAPRRQGVGVTRAR
jgi:DNA-nicking Smr family endonuclease